MLTLTHHSTTFFHSRSIYIYKLFHPSITLTLILYTTCSERTQEPTTLTVTASHERDKTEAVQLTLVNHTHNSTGAFMGCQDSVSKSGGTSSTKGNRVSIFSSLIKGHQNHNQIIQGRQSQYSICDLVSGYSLGEPAAYNIPTPQQSPHY